MKKITIIILCALSLSACEQGSKEGFGTFFGAIGGAVIGSAIGGDSYDGQMIGVALGTVAGAAIGSSIGRQLDEADQLKMYQAQNVALESYPTGQTSTWYNPDTGNSGSYVPQAATQNRAGEYCREYQQTVSIGGETQQAYGKACRQPDGNWKIVNDQG